MCKLLLYIRQKKNYSKSMICSLFHCFFKYIVRKKRINEVKWKTTQKKMISSFLHLFIHTTTNVYIRVYILLLFLCFVQYFFKVYRKEKLNCILIIKATHAHTHTHIIRCPQIRQMSENKYRCRRKRKKKPNKLNINILFIDSCWSIMCSWIRWTECCRCWT